MLTVSTWVTGRTQVVTTLLFCPGTHSLTPRSAVTSLHGHLTVPVGGRGRVGASPDDGTSHTALCWLYQEELAVPMLHEISPHFPNILSLTLQRAFLDVFILLSPPLPPGIILAPQIHCVFDYVLYRICTLYTIG